MKTLAAASLLALLSLAALHAQEPAPGGLVIPPLLALPAPEDATPETPPKPRGNVRQLLDAGSFERPRVDGRRLSTQKGDPAPKSQGDWAQLKVNAAARKGNGLTTGLTNEISRTGRQALFLSFNQCREQLARVDLVSGAIPVKGDFTYRVAIYGRLDKKTPLTIDQRLPLLRLQVDFLAEDGETQTGETELRVQPMPGSLNRPAVFTTDRWTEYFADVESPADARFVRVTWSWVTPQAAGETTGVIYFDDAVILGERVEQPETDVSEIEAVPAEAPAAPAPPR